MRDGASKSFEQCYNAQIAVDEQSQVIVAARVTQDANDKRQLIPMVADLKARNDGTVPEKLSVDNGYFSEDNVKHCESEGIDAYIATGRTKHGAAEPSAPPGGNPQKPGILESMRQKLRTPQGRTTYSKRKQIVEPVFGQIKQARGLRGFLLRGLDKVASEWELFCATHNLLKLFRAKTRRAGA